ncbi:hypothetical protein BC941DRAFT_514503 [Chlamydoabsidia padenii]|nr:hypothetical protein BC941DRAFT_514503 [Chlamydoabsidia padenii]
MSCQKKLLQKWKISTCRHLCLDIRTPQEFKLNHLQPSTNIPFDQLKKRMAELPPKHIPFALVTFSNYTSTTTTTTFGAKKVKRYIDKESLDEGEHWLLEHGWQPHYVFRPGQDPCFWPKARLVECDDDEPQVNKPWILYQPHALLKDYMDLIVKTLGGQGRHILDIGCGSGRDLTWLLLHQPTWYATGVDHLAGAQERFASMTRSIRDRAHFSSAKVMADGSWKTINLDSTIAISPVEHTQPVNQQQYDMVMTIRFFIRPFLPILPNLVKPGGLLIISHFLDRGNYQQPKKERRLWEGELNQFAQQMGLTILVDRIEWIEDGIRPVQSMILQKPVLSPPLISVV